MKKLTFLLTSTEHEAFITDVRKLGVVHVDNLSGNEISPELQEALDTDKRYKNALLVLQNASVTYTTDKQFVMKAASVETGCEALKRTEALVAEEKSLLLRRDAADVAIGKLDPWGEFSWDKVAELASHGTNMYFFCCPNKMFKAEWAELYYATPVNEVNKKLYFVAFADKQPDITAECLELPAQPLSYYRQQHVEIEEGLARVHNELLRINGELAESIQAAQIDNLNNMNFSKVCLSAESLVDGCVKLMRGWCLAENEKAIVDYLEQNNICYEVSDPAFEDEVPVKIVNDGFSSLFEPILRMYSLPNYHDIDPLPLFAPFFMLFFGLCMGDAGYGILITAISLFIVSTKPALKSYGMLGALLGVMTIICGGITGSFFGIDLAKVEWEWIKPVQPYFVNDSMKEHFFGYSPMMVISVIIGLVQVLIGMTMAGCKAVKNYGFVYGVGKFSWVTALLSAVVLYGLPMFGVVIPMALQMVLYVLIAISAFGIYFLNNPAAYAKAGSLSKLLGVGMNLGGGLWATYGMSTGLLGDLLSYIRLFALGLTGGVLGSVFNSLAMDMSPDIPVVHEIVMLLILLFGHGINFGLCMISSFVHPMRLTFVEYFKNAEFDGGGKEFKPFKKINA